MKTLVWSKLTPADRKNIGLLIAEARKQGKNQIKPGIHSVSKVTKTKRPYRSTFKLTQQLLFRPAKKDPIKLRVEVLDALIGEGGQGQVVSSQGVLKEELGWLLSDAIVESLKSRRMIPKSYQKQ